MRPGIAHILQGSQTRATTQQMRGSSFKMLNRHFNRQVAIQKPDPHMLRWPQRGGRFQLRNCWTHNETPSDVGTTMRMQSVGVGFYMLQIPFREQEQMTCWSCPCPPDPLPRTMSLHFGYSKHFWPAKEERGQVVWHLCHSSSWLSVHRSW